MSTRPGASFLINASPDIRSQIEGDPDLHPSPQRGARNTPIKGILLTSADLDQVLGLLLLREFQPLTVYTTVAIREALETNPFFKMLTRVPEQLSWVEIHPDEPFLLDDSVRCTPIALGEHMPHYLRSSAANNSGFTTLGLVLECEGRRIAYTPSVPRVSNELCATYETCDAIFVDGTFWSDTELSATQPGTPLAREIGHLPMSGDDGSMVRLAGVKRPEKIFVHINNTNPVLDEQSAEYKSVCAAGWKIGHDGWRLALPAK